MENYSVVKPEYIKSRKRVGRGRSSGMGKTCGRGMNGQLSRSGSKKRAWFEGGQMPLQRRVPKRGFNNIFKKFYQLVNVDQLEGLSVDELTPEKMVELGLISKVDKLIKVLGDGELSKSVKITADAFSKSATEKILKAGGQAIIR